MGEFAVLAHRFYGEAHFFFFFFLMISACVLKACASDLIWSATYVSAEVAATRSAVTACCRIAFVIFMSVSIARPARGSKQMGLSRMNLRGEHQA